MSQSYEFIRDRLDDQIKYYSSKSRHNKSRYNLTQIIIIALGVIIPIVNLIPLASDNPDIYPFFLVISGIIASAIGFTAALSQLNKYYENWINFRGTLELLKREKSLYLNNAGGYFNLNEQDKKRIFVDKIEELLSTEHTKYFSSYQQQMNPIQYIKGILTEVNELNDVAYGNASNIENKKGINKEQKPIMIKNDQKEDNVVIQK